MRNKINAIKVFIAIKFSILAMFALRADPVTTVQELVKALQEKTTSTDVIEVAPGEYDLTDICMREDASFGNSHLYLQNATLKGMGNSRDDVKLIGNGLRVLWAYRTDYASPAKVVNLTIMNGNAGLKNGGGLLGNCTVSNSVIRSCSAISGGGTSNYTRLYDCLIEGNQATTGGGVYEGSCYGCVISNNYASGSGGGVYNTTVQRGDVVANYAGAKGGGASYSRILNAMVYNNYAVSNGGGLEYGNAVSCIISNNFCGANGPNAAFTSPIDRCDVSGTPCYQIVAVGSKFHDIGLKVSLSGNAYAQAEIEPTYLLNNYVNCTNCLFYNNKSQKTDSAIFGGNSGATKASSIINCTVVSNTYAYMFKYFQTPNHPLTVINCVFYNNSYKNGDSRDISMSGTKAIDPQSIRFSNCAYGKSNVANLSDFVVQSMYQFGENGFGKLPRFVGDKDLNNPYGLKLSSPLCGKGQYMDWMANANDLRGDGFPRVRDENVVDIGAYQCWLNPVGFTIRIK